MAEIRTFIAAEIPNEIREQLWKLRAEFSNTAPEVRWVRKEGIHLTLKFLGDVEETKIKDIQNELSEAVKNSGKIYAEIKSLGAFPKAATARVIWVGVSGELEKIKELWTKVETVMDKFGFEREKRDFVPHITLGRIKNPRLNRKLAEKISEMTEREFGRFEIKDIVIFKSQLLPQGAVYSELARIVLE